MAEITLHYTPEELKILLDALNHGCIALRKIYASACLGCEIPAEFEATFKSMTFEEIDEYTHLRFNGLRELYEYLLTFEE